jgi:hypothetical protein
MKANRKTQTIICLAAIILFASSCFAQQSGTDKNRMLNLSIEGKISYVQRTGYYMATTESPSVEYFIVNPDAKTLDKLIKQGKPVKIDGYLTVGADQLFVEKINGKKYTPAKQK